MTTPSTPAVNALDILRDRGFFYQNTNEEGMRQRLGEGPATFYVGFDPTGNSLHVGHLLPVMAMRWLQQCGHKPIALVGGGTAMIGDPSGKTEARPIMSVDIIDDNARAIQGQLGRFLDFAPDKATMVNNADWLRDLRLIDFLRDIGSLFSVPRMLSAESVRMRLETGISFLEFSYPLLQSFDFYYLCKERQCQFQFGGQDQWGNIVAGVELTRRLLGQEVFGATFPLLLKSDGTKFGKTAGGAVWLDTARTSVFDYYQFWRNVDDADVTKLLGFFTTLPMDEVRRLGSLSAPAINRAKEILGYEATALAHGHDEAIKAFLAAAREFGFADPDGQIETSSRIREADCTSASEDIPTVEISAADLTAGLGILALLVKAGLCASNSDARRLIKGGGCYLNDDRVGDEKLVIAPEHFHAGMVTLRAGKKARKRIKLV
jgi:tyrosyl-tRNA synthetase